MVDAIPCTPYCSYTLQHSSLFCLDTGSNGILRAERLKPCSRFHFEEHSTQFLFDVFLMALLYSCGRKVLPEAYFCKASYQGKHLNPFSRQRRRVLHETLATFDHHALYYHQCAQDNLHRWGMAKRDCSPNRTLDVFVMEEDWGVATEQLTRDYGKTFAVLNMANAHLPGGGYMEGAGAQEENMFRRTDCHFSLDHESIMLSRSQRYTPEMTELLEGRLGRVYLDTDRPRVCVRGPEMLESRADLGYDWLPEDSIFPFFELRAAAQRVRQFRTFNVEEARRRIAAQLDTLIEKRVRHAVLGAHGCGAFRNPADEISKLYREELEIRREQFDVITFAIFHAGYGPRNYLPFEEAFRSF